MTHRSRERRIAEKLFVQTGWFLLTGKTLPTLAVVGILGFATLSSVGHSTSPVNPELERIKRHVTTLSSPEFGGRRGEFSSKTREYLVGEFRTLGLEPLFGGSFFQEIAGGNPGKNVGAFRQGTDPKLKDEWIIVGAHFDALGVRNGILYPGADDNASAVAMMLEIARCLANPRRSVIFIGFDLEELGLLGSRYFAEHPPINLDRVSLFITADMIGRSLGGVGGNFVFLMGTEQVPAIRPWIREAAAGRPLTVGLLGADLLLLDRSDYGPFRSRKIPYLFASTGENPCYHRPSDIGATLDYPKAEAITGMILEIVRRSADEEDRFRWSEPPDFGFQEVPSLRVVYELLIDHSEELKIGSTARFLLKKGQADLKAIESRGHITPIERSTIIRISQVIMSTIF